MSLINVLLSKSKAFNAFILLLSVVNGVVNTLLLVFISNTISGERVTAYPVATFVALLLTGFIVNKVFQTHMIRLTNQVLYEFETSVLDKLKNTTYESFQNLGTEKVYTVISDARSLANVPELFVNALNAVVIILCAFAYLFVISPGGAALILVIVVALLMLYIYRNRDVEQRLNKLRDLYTSYYRYLNDFLWGFKEIKMSLHRNESIVEDCLKKNRQESKLIGIQTSIKYLNNELAGSYSWYVVLGVIMFVLPPVMGFKLEDITAFLIAILYLMGPVAVLITLIPTYTNVKIAGERMAAFEEEIKVLNRVSANVVKPWDPAFESLQFADIEYAYPGAGGFALGPLSLTFKKGELVFVTGGNGSGKTTFVNLAAGLFKPTAGRLLYNGVEINDELRPSYSDCIGVIFSEVYLFNDNYDDLNFSDPATKERLNAYLLRLRLEEIVRVDYQHNRIDNRLSKGQRKRLALLYLLLEDKPVAILDECAADQDPHFKKYFYTTFLPRLRDEGKTIIVITHDDFYFDYCDRLLRLEYGQIVEPKTWNSSFIYGNAERNV